MANSRDERHRYGQHYTPREVARLLAAFAIRSPHDLVFDPSCGDGRLLAEAQRLKGQLAASDGFLSLTGENFGVERSQSAAQLARETGACVAVADFFDLEPRARLSRTTSLPFEFDAIVGNPPYIRHEIQGTSDKGRIVACLARDRVVTRGLFWPRWSGRSDIYVYFFAHSIRFLKMGGRLVFLTSSSWLDVGYGAPLREFLLSNFRVIAVIESGCESFFEDASINTTITVLELEPNYGAREDHPIRFVRFNRKLGEILDKLSGDNIDRAVQLARNIERGKPSSGGKSYKMRLIAQSELLNTETKEHKRGARAVMPGWGMYLRADQVFFKIINRGSLRLRSLSKMASVRFGVKTGANEFFYVTEEGRGAEATKAEGGRRKAEGRSHNGYSLVGLADVASIRRGITTGANEFFYVSRAESQTKNEENRVSAPHQNATRPGNGLTTVRGSGGELREIESSLLSPVIFSLKQIRGVLLEAVESQRMLFNCSLPANELSGTHALDYINSGQREGYDQRPTCASREPWYSVARSMTPAPLIFPSKVGERWVVALNRAGVFEDKKLYGIFPGLGVAEEPLAALLNSTWARYYAEITCRQMTGAQAIADIDVAVAEQILIPDPRDLAPSITKRLTSALAAISRRPVYSIFEEANRADRRRLDALTLEAIGFDKKAEREAVLDQLYKAVTELVRARLAK